MKASLDHYVGQAITKVADTEQGFDITLESGVIVHSTDPVREAPGEEIVGMQLLSAMLSESETRLMFGQTDKDSNLVKSSTVFLNPTEYYIADPAYDTPQYPQESEVDEVLAARPQEPTERLQEGPEEESAEAES